MSKLSVSEERAVIDVLNELTPTMRDKIIQEIFRTAKDARFAHKSEAALGSFIRLLGQSPTEEDIHQFLEAHLPMVLGRGEDNARKTGIHGSLSKFPVAPDRIVDFMVFDYKTAHIQSLGNSVRLIEIKKPDAKIFLKSGRMSQELNDALMECVEATRLLLINYEDIQRRSIKKLQLDDMGGLDVHALLCETPKVQCEIYIGRRHQLSTENLATLRALSGSGGIQIRTYDSIVDHLEMVTRQQGYLSFDP